MLQVNNRLGTAGRNYISLLLCLVLAGSLLAACGSNKDSSVETSKPVNAAAAHPVAEGQKPSGERTVTDELGHEVKLPAEVKNVFAPNMEDSIVKLGVKPVAQWSNGQLGHSYLQEELKDIPKIDFSGGMPSPEVLLSYKPDLIVLHNEAFAGNGTYEKYSKIAPTYVFKNAGGDIEKSIATLGELLGKSTEADQAVKGYQQKATEAKEKLSQVAAGKKAAIIRFAPRGVSIMGGQYFAGKVVHQDIGLGMSKFIENKTASNLSMELLPELDVDYIFIINQYGQGTERMKEMTESPIWQGMPAVKNGHVYEVSTEYWLGSGLIAYEKMIADVVRSITSK